MEFTEFGLSDNLLDGLDAMGFKEATPVQEEAIPIILEGHDLIACAQTGTGKTAAFLLPILNKLTSEQRKSHSINTIILVPTRELAIQIDRQLEGFGYFTGTSNMAIYGGRDGQSFSQEKKAFSMGADIIVATPGRLIAHLNLGYVNLTQFEHLVLDEADRMMDMGFVNDIDKITSYLPKDRQTLMFSATMPPKIRQLAKKTMKNPKQISFAVSQPAEGVLQGAYLIEDNQKLPLLKDKLEDRRDKEGQIIIFASTKSKVKDITYSLKNSGLNVDQMHSDFDQQHREEVIRQFRNKSLQILVATDILSRGIDVKGIDLVINYDVPPDPEDYIHRIGRTARAGREGIAITLVNRKDGRKFKAIENLMQKEVRKMKLPKHLAGQTEEISSQSRGGRRSGGRNNRRSGGGSNRRRSNNNRSGGRNRSRDNSSDKRRSTEKK